MSVAKRKGQTSNRARRRASSAGVGQRGLVGGEGEASGRFTDRKQKKTVRAANAQNGQSTLSGAGGELCRGGDLLHGFSLAHLFCECKGFLLPG
jgi:hypothetical protein